MKRDALKASKEEKFPVFKMAEVLTGPTTIIDSSGKHHTVRRFLWMGNWGFTDKDAKKVIVPAKPGYLQATVLVHAQVLVAGYYSTGWDVFSLEGEKIKSYHSPMYLHQLENLINNELKGEN